MHKTLSRWLLLVSTALWLGCTGEPVTVCETPNGTSCDECIDGDFTCTYNDVSVTTPACAGCQTRIALHEELCAQGSTDLRDDVEAGMVCEGPFDSGQ